MKMHWCIVLTAGLAMSGCTALQNFPDTAKNTVTELEDLDPQYLKALDKIYGTKDPVDQTSLRNQFIENRLAVLDVHFTKFVTGLAQDDVTADVGVADGGIIAGTVGALVPELVSQALSAVFAALTGGQATHDKSVLYDKMLSALIAQMRASRLEIVAAIYEKWKASLVDYPLLLARRDLAAYAFAGSLPGAIVATAADAKMKEVKANQTILNSTVGQ